ncbi:MAG: glycosyltransferase family 2 protein [Pseudomonadota bacterium]
MSSARAQTSSQTFSVVVPAKDEAQNLPTLVDQILAVFDDLGPGDHDIILVDDGSTDRTWEIIGGLVKAHGKQIQGVRLRRNFGKAVALDCGFRHARGDVIITMDADLQDDPAEIPRFLDAMNNGYDVVSGWKQNRQDPVSKTLPSRLFNWVTARISGIPLHDFNCGFKAYRRAVLEQLQLYGELHRYIPVLAFDAGYSITEVPVRHRARTHGKSKYGLERYARGVLDLITVLATTRYLHKPGHLFGGIGLIAGILGTLILAYLSVLWVLGLGPIGTRPLFFLGVLLEILCIQLLSLGVLAELVTRHSNRLSTLDLVEEALLSESGITTPDPENA